MSREKVKTYRYTCDGMKPVTHAEDGREYTLPMVALCDGTADFQATSTWAADRLATEAGWVIADGQYYCDTSHTPWFGLS